jgi:putative endonuclease
MKTIAVYILTNKRDGVLYTGVTSDLMKRIFEHKQKTIEGFTKKYNCTQLVFYELHDFIDTAIEREKKIKSKSRKNKLALINQMNPTWKDLYNDIIL